MSTVVAHVTCTYGKDLVKALVWSVLRPRSYVLAIMETPKTAIVSGERLIRARGLNVLVHVDMKMMSLLIIVVMSFRVHPYIFSI